MAVSTGAVRNGSSNKAGADTVKILGVASGVKSSLSTLKLSTGLRPSTLTGSAGITGGTAVTAGRTSGTSGIANTDGERLLKKFSPVEYLGKTCDLA